MAKIEDRAPPSPASLNDDIGETKRLAMYRMQVEIREAEQRAYDLFLQNLVKGTSHLSLGQEAVAAGFAAAMQPGDLSLLHLSRPCPYARPRRADREGAGRADAARQRPDARQGRLDAPDLGRAWRDGLLRHHRRASADRLRRGLAGAVQGRQGRLGLLLRRRHHQYRRFPRGAEFRGRSGSCRWSSSARTISTWNTRRSATSPRCEHPAADRASAYGLRAHRHRRQRCRRGLPHRADRLRQGARRRRAVADRMHDLSPQRPFARRSRPNTGPRASSSAGRSATR